MLYYVLYKYVASWKMCVCNCASATVPPTYRSYTLGLYIFDRQFYRQKIMSAQDFEP